MTRHLSVSSCETERTAVYIKVVGFVPCTVTDAPEAVARRCKVAEVVLVRVFADCNNDRIHSALEYVSQMRLLVKWRVGINEDQNYSEKDAKTILKQGVQINHQC